MWHTSRRYNTCETLHDPEFKSTRVLHGRYAINTYDVFQCDYDFSMFEMLLFKPETGDGRVTLKGPRKMNRFQTSDDCKQITDCGTSLQSADRCDSSRCHYSPQTSLRRGTQHSQLFHDHWWGRRRVSCRFVTITRFSWRTQDTPQNPVLISGVLAKSRTDYIPNTSPAPTCSLPMYPAQ